MALTSQNEALGASCDTSEPHLFQKGMLAIKTHAQTAAFMLLCSVGAVHADDGKGVQLADASDIVTPVSVTDAPQNDTVSLLGTDGKVDIFQGQERKLSNISAELFAEYFAVGTNAVSYEVGVTFYNELVALDTEYGDTVASDLFLQMLPQTQIYTLKAYAAGISGEQKEASSWLADNLVYLNWEIEVLIKYTSTGELVEGVTLESLPHPEITLAGIIENFPEVTGIITPAIQSRISSLEADIIPSLERRLNVEKAETQAEKAETQAEKAETQAEKAETERLANLEATLLTLYPKN